MINDKLSQPGHRYSEKEIEVMENQIISERRELMRIFRQLTAEKEKHKKLKREDLKIQDILSANKCKEIQDSIPKQQLQRIESEIFLATISGPNFNEHVCSYRDYIAAISISTYPVLQGAGRAGDPICDFYYARLFGQGTIFALADGCNWGEAPKQAAQRAATCFVRYIQDRLYRLLDTKQVTKEILKAFGASHDAIMLGKETDFFQIGTATLIGGALLPLEQQKKDFSAESQSLPSLLVKKSASAKLKSRTRRRRKTTEINQLHSSKIVHSDPPVFVSPRDRRKDRLSKSSGGLSKSHSGSSSKSKTTITMDVDSLDFTSNSTKSQDASPSTSPPLTDRETVAPRSKRKKCMRKLSPRAMSDNNNNSNLVLETKDQDEKIVTSKSPRSPGSSRKSKTPRSPKPERRNRSGSQSKDEEHKLLDHIPTSSSSNLKESEDHQSSHISPPGELRKLVPVPAVNQNVTKLRDRKKEYSPLSKRRKSTKMATPITTPTITETPNRHKSFTHYGFAGNNQIDEISPIKSDKIDQSKLTNTIPQTGSTSSPSLTKQQQALKDKSSTTIPSSGWAFVFGSVGDCKVFLYNPVQQKITDITSYNRGESINAADCGGRLGPCDKAGRPDLRNLFVVSATVQENDLILLVTDGVHDNLDPELLGKSPHDVDSSLDENITWDNLTLEDSSSLKNHFRELKLAEIINNLPKKTPKNICKYLSEYCRSVTEASRSFMENNPSLELPDDYSRYPGKMDHTSCICIKVGSRNNHTDIKLVRDAFVRKETLSITHK